MVIVPLDRLPGLPGDPQDDERDRQADQRVGDRQRRPRRPPPRRSRPARHRRRRARGGRRRPARGCPAARPRGCGRCAAMKLPAKPTAPAPASAQRWSGGLGWMSRRTARRRRPGADEDRRDHEQAGAALGALGAQQEGDASGTAVSASPKLWIRSASSATEPDSDEDDRLRDRGERRARPARQHRAHAGARALDRVVDETVRVAVVAGCVTWRAAAHAQPAVGRRAQALRRCSTCPIACSSSSPTWSS